VLSIVLNPLVFKITPVLERALLKIPSIRRRSEKHLVEPDILRQSLKDHVVVVGMGRIGSGVIRVLGQLEIPHLVVETDLELASDLQRGGTPVLYGDAANSEIILHMGLTEARALIVTISDEVSGELIVAAAHQLAPELPIVARAATADGVRQMLDHGAHHVVHPELEGGLEIIRHMLLDLGYSPERIQRYADEVRRHAYALSESDGRRPYALDQLVSASRSVEIQWYTVAPESTVCDTRLSDTNIRARTGASVIALMRDGLTMPNPKSNITFQAGDMIGVIGSPQELEAAASLISSCPLERTGPDA
jgi:CPA2 family monovalent cation:H+ antiporter-2